MSFETSSSRSALRPIAMIIAFILLCWIIRETIFADRVHPKKKKEDVVPYSWDSCVEINSKDRYEYTHRFRVWKCENSEEICYIGSSGSHPLSCIKKERPSK